MTGALRLCLICGTKYEPIQELHEGGACPNCDSRIWAVAVSSDYRLSGVKPKRPLPGSTDDYRR